MRIISGKYKGKRLTAPKNLPVRPTTDMSKESLFNILNNKFYFDEVKVLDLFSGTGNLSYEFGSRGTKTITAVDADYGCIRYIKQTAEALELNITVIKSDVYKFLKNHKLSYDVIVADPPYDFDQQKFEEIVTLVFENELLDKEGTMVIEHSPQTDLEHMPYFVMKKKYGSSIFSFFEIQ